MAFSDQRQFLVSISGISGSFWAQLSGGDLSVPTTKAFDGGNPIPQVLTGNPTVDDLVCTRNYDPGRDGPIAQQLKAQIMAGQPFLTTISQDPTDPAYRPTGNPPDVWSGTLTKVTTPKTDASKTGATAATIALTFTCTSLT
jgi:hypothetical protein